jgi:AsmA protein
MRKKVWIGSSVFASFIILILFLPSIFKEEVKNILSDEMNANFSANISFSDADLNLWRRFPRFTVTLHDFVAAGTNEFQGDTLLKTRELHVVMSSVNFLLFNEVKITELGMHQPDVHILIHKNGQANHQVFRSTTDSLSHQRVDVEIESLTIDDGNFLYQDHANDLQLKGEGLTLTGRMDVVENLVALDVQAEAQQFTGSLNAEKYIADKTVLVDLDMVYNTTSGLLTMKDNHAQINHLEVGFSGTYQRLVTGHFVDLTFESADSDFKDLLSVNNGLFRDFRRMDVKGRFSLDGFLKGVYDNSKNSFPTFRFGLKVDDGLIKYSQLPSSLNNIHFDLEAFNTDSIFDHTTVEVRKFKMNLGDNPIEGDFKINGLTNSIIKSDITVSIKLEDLQKIYPIDSVALSGKLNFGLHADGQYKGSFSDIGSTDKWWTAQVPGFNLSLNLSEGTLKYHHLPQAFTGVNFHMTASNKSKMLNHTQVRIEKLTAKLGDNPLTGFIHFQGFRNPLINAEVKGSMDFSDLSDLLPADGTDLKGLFDVDMKVSGQWNDSLKTFPMVDARMNLKNGYIKSADYPSPMENTHLIVEAVNKTGHVRDTRLRIDTLTYTIDEEQFFVRGEIEDLDKLNYDLAVKGVLYLDKLNKILQLEGIQMAGELDVDFRASGNYGDLLANRYHRLPTTGKIVMKNVIFQNNDIPHGLKVRRGHVSFSNERLILDTLDASLGESDFMMTGHLTNYLAYAFHNEEKISGDLLLTSDYFNLNEILKSEKPTRNDTVHHHLSTIVIPGNIDFTFDTDISNLIYKNLSVTDLTGEVVVRDGILALHETKFSALDANFQLSGDYDSKPAHPLFDLAIDVKDLDITRAHDAFLTVQAVAPAAEHTYGIFSVSYSLKGELMPNMTPVLESISGGGTIRIREAQVNGMKLFHHISGITRKEELKNPMLKDIVMETTVSSGVVAVKPFSMKLAGFDTEIQGEHQLSGPMNYVLKIALPPFEIVKIPLHVSGTYDKPKIHLGKGHEGAFDKSISSNSPTF